MDYRCPNCGEDLGKRKLAHSIVTKMEVDCPKCLRRVQLNVHSVEAAAMVLYFAGFVGLVALGYLLDRRDLLGTGVIIGLLGWAGVTAIERVYLRSWPRYVLKKPQT
jgi:DNA-directed RNA polymerase subunit RPC12/RpoP